MTKKLVKGESRLGLTYVSIRLTVETSKSQSLQELEPRILVDRLNWYIRCLSLIEISDLRKHWSCLITDFQGASATQAPIFRRNLIQIVVLDNLGFPLPGAG
ncbi:uncharacterized protein LOC111518652 [Drosophila willistoni]|uniref:uncharacterized protein LOC111518652 n=1 Tax=Drosophila willistoni TaxID=7260 RepID=UPI000C26D55B|nr:uncharacterized protein LOC111518652 [Drosophila willistoni]